MGARLERDWKRYIYASNMLDLLSEEDNISNYILNYVKCKLNKLFESEFFITFFSIFRPATFLQVSTKGNWDIDEWYEWIDK